jgi:hypothetical protein
MTENSEFSIITHLLAEKTQSGWADKVSATDSPREENGCNYSGKISKKENKTG